jgi:hypothetical protein
VISNQLARASASAEAFVFGVSNDQLLLTDAAVRSYEAPAADLPRRLAIVALIMFNVFLQGMYTAGRAGTAAVQPIAVSIQAILDVVIVY